MTGGSTPEGSEARSAKRRRVLLGGKIVYGDGAFTYDCSIRDLSASGARIGIPGAVVLPKRFHLIDLRQAAGYDCEIVWRNATQTGVTIRSAFSLADLSDSKLAFLRRLYVEACLR